MPNIGELDGHYTLAISSNLTNENNIPITQAGLVLLAGRFGAVDVGGNVFFGRLSDYDGRTVSFECFALGLLADDDVTLTSPAGEDTRDWQQMSGRLAITKAGGNMTLDGTFNHGAIEISVILSRASLLRSI